MEGFDRPLLRRGSVCVGMLTVHFDPMDARFDEPGEQKIVIPEKARAFAEWFCTPITERNPQHQRDWAEANIVDEETLRRWKASGWWMPLLKDISGSDFGFTSYHDLLVMEALWVKALKGDTTAMKMYVEMRGIQQKGQAAGADPSAMSDDEVSKKRAEIEARRQA